MPVRRVPGPLMGCRAWGRADTPENRQIGGLLVEAFGTASALPSWLSSRVEGAPMKGVCAGLASPSPGTDQGRAGGVGCSLKFAVPGSRATYPSVWVRGFVVEAATAGSLAGRSSQRGLDHADVAHRHLAVSAAGDGA